MFASVSYGLFGSLMGIGGAVALSVVPVLRSQVLVLASAAAAAAAALGMVVSRFRIIRDLFGESLAMASAAGIAVHLGVLVGGALFALVIWQTVAASGERRGAIAAGLRFASALVVAAVALSLGLNAVVGGEPQAAVGAASAKGPNVLLIIADTLRADHTGPYGASDVSTPALDALASDSVVFEHTFAHSSWTRPSISTILTSLYASSHSVMLKTDLLPDEVVTVAEVMRDDGYLTSGFVTNINVAPSFNFQQGFDSYEYLSPDFFFGASDSGSKLSLYSGMRLIRERFLSREKYVEHYYQDAVSVNGRALPWLAEYGEEPFFTFIHYMDPHDPYFELPYNGKAVARVDTPNPAGDRAEELRGLYAGNIEYLDGFLAAVFSGLKQAGLYDDMIIVFTADHGEEFHEHGGWWHGTTLYDEQLHVPLMVKFPGNVRGGTRVSQLSGLVDVMPTMLAAAGLEVPASAQGRDLMSTKAPAAVYAEEDHEGNVLESVRSAQWKLIVANEGNPRGLDPVEMYDLVADPGETHNLASSDPDRVAALQESLAGLRALARQSAVAGVSGEMDDAARERLRALGYIE